MTCAGRSRSRSLARPVSARTRRTSPGGNALAITPRLMWSLTRMPAGRPAGMRAIIASRPRARASMAQLSPYVNRIEATPAPIAGPRTAPIRALPECPVLKWLPDQPSQLADDAAPEGEDAEDEDRTLDDRDPAAELGEVVLEGDD